MFDDGYVSPAYAEMENLHQQQYQLHEKLRAITETMRLIDSVNPSTMRSKGWTSCFTTHASGRTS